MKIDVFKKYTVMDDKDIPVYSLSCPSSGSAEKVSIEIPDEMLDGTTGFGVPLVKLDGHDYPLDIVLITVNGGPCLVWSDEEMNEYTYPLKEC